MTVLFDTVDGCVLTIQDIHSSIPFTTPSDALFSSLFVKFKGTVPMELFEAMLALFRHADFHSSAVTIRRSEDILDRISIQRQQIAKDRNSRRVTVQIACGPPTTCHSQATNLIPVLLAEYIDSQRRPFLRMIERQSYHYNKEIADDELKTMALVHRSWTDVAQRYLRRRICISSPKSLRSVMQSTTIGPWVRELSSICLSYSDPKIATVEMPRLLAGVLQRCPNLTRLNLQGYQTGLSIDVSHDVLGHLADLRYLEHLSLGHYLWINYLEFWKLATILHNLRCLKSMSLRQWRIDCRNFPEGQEAISPDAPIPPATLEALSLVDVEFFNSGIFSWLLNARNGITKLELCLSDFRCGRLSKCMELTSSLFMKARTSHITKLKLVGCWSTDILNLVLGFFPSLQVLSLHPDVSEKTITLGSFVLPYGTTWSFHYHYLAAQETDQDPLALAMLKAYPNIRRFLITYSIWDCHIPSTLFKNSIEYAARNNVESEVTEAEREDIPHIFYV